MSLLAVLTDGQLLLFYLVLFLSFLFLFLYFIFSYWKPGEKAFPSPYTGIPLRYAREVPLITQERVIEYLQALHDFDNRPFDFSKAAFCRETGRLFPDSVNWWGSIIVDAHFLNKRHKGGWVSWGSVPESMKTTVIKAHRSLQGFQTQFSSSLPLPRLIEEKFAYAKPGPLYLDPATHVLLGWKIVPETNVEVLIVQKPTVVTMLKINTEEKKSPLSSSNTPKKLQSGQR